MEFRKATQADLDYVKQNPIEGAVKNYPYAIVPENNCIAAVFEGNVIGVGGVEKYREGVGLFWLILTDTWLKGGLHGIVVLRAIRDNMNELIETNNLWRAEAHVRVDFPKGIRMIEFLGFQREGTMRMFFPDKVDGYLYSRIMI